MAQSALAGTGSDARPKRRGLRKIFRSSSKDSSSSVVPRPAAAGGMKYSQSVPSLSALTDASIDSGDEFFFGCLKVRTLKESLQHSSSSYRSNAEDFKSSPNVDFSTVEVRSHPMILGDNPSVSSGLPVTIDWKPQDILECDLTHYEQVKPLRRSRSEIALPARLREAWIMDQGYARSELQQVSKEIAKIKKARNETFRKATRPPMFSLRGSCSM